MFRNVLLGLSLSLFLVACSEDKPAAQPTKPVGASKAPAEPVTSPAPAAAPAEAPKEETPAAASAETPVTPATLSPAPPETESAPVTAEVKTEADVFAGVESLKEEDATKGINTLQLIISAYPIKGKDARKKHLDEQEAKFFAELKARGDILWTIETESDFKRKYYYAQKEEFTRYALALLATRLLDSLPAGKKFQTETLGQFTFDLSKIAYYNDGTIDLGRRALKRDDSVFRTRRFGKASYIRDEKSGDAIGAELSAEYYQYKDVESSIAAGKSNSSSASTVGLVGRGRLVVQAFLQPRFHGDKASNVWVGLLSTDTFTEQTTFQSIFGGAGWSHIDPSQQNWKWEIPTVSEKAAQ